MNKYGIERDVAGAIDDLRSILNDVEVLLRIAANEASRGRREGARRAFAAATVECQRVSDRVLEAGDDIDLWMVDAGDASFESRSAL
ncbi:MAG: hypothetical protein IV100_29845 [Myxococcales bacterium]|nr:hypothetical protein [Myxococcales bacterium]